MVIFSIFGDFFGKKRGKLIDSFLFFFCFLERQFRAVTIFSKPLQQVTTYEPAKV